MKFSVIVPVYNVEKFLAKCLDSILQQTYQDYEIVAVNDGSTDSSVKILKQYQEKSTKVRVITQKNKGLGGARNTGIQNAQGEFLVFLDSDDYIENNMLEILAQYLEKYKLDILAFDCNLVNLYGEILQRATFSGSKDKYTSLTQQEFLLLEPTSCTKVYRRTLYIEHNIKFPERLWYEDLATVFKLAPFAKNIGYLKLALYCYVQQDGSITHSTNTKRMMEIETAFNSNVEYFKKQGFWEKFQDELEWNAILHVLYYSAFRLLGCGYHKKNMEDLLIYIESIFPNWKENKYLSDQKKKRYLMDLIVDHKYYKFYLKTGFWNKYVTPIIAKMKNGRRK